MKVANSTHVDISWFVQRARCAVTPDARAIKAVDDVGSIRGMVVYDNWTANAAQMHVAIDAPIVARHLIRPAFDYVFRHAQKSMVFGIVPSHHSRSLSLALGLGFHETHRVQDGWSNGSDLVFLEMRREECRWLTQ